MTRAGWTGLVLLAGLGILAVAGSSLARYRVAALSGDPLMPPGADHWLGTNSVGQDLASQLLAGARASMLVALLGGGATVALATVAGAAAGWCGGLVDAAIMRVVDLGLALPTIPLLVVVGAYVRPSLLSLAAIIAFVSWPLHARIIRAQVLSLRRRDHLQASVGFGASTVHVLARHVLPESSLVIAATYIRAAERAIALEVGLAFLGLSISTQGSWGTTMRDAIDFHGLALTHAWSWWLLPPVAAVSLVLTALALVGTSLEERVNPRLSRHRGDRIIDTSPVPDGAGTGEMG